MKHCYMCGLVKPFPEFANDRYRKDGKRSRCKPCDKSAVQSWRAANPEKLRDREARRYAANPEQAIARAAQWAKENPGATARARAKHPERYRARVRQYAKENAEVKNAINAARRARKLKASPAWANPDAIAGMYAAAKTLGQIFGAEYHVDHIVPLLGETVCGLHNEFNLQILPAVDNLKKSNRVWPDMP